MECTADGVCTYKPKSARSGGKLAIDADFNGFEGVTLKDKINSVLKNCKVVVFSKTECPYCVEVAALFDSKEVSYNYFKLDVIKDGTAVWDTLKEVYTQKTVPYVFIGGKLIGGCSDTKALDSKGELDGVLKAAGVTPAAKKEADSSAAAAPAAPSYAAVAAKGAPPAPAPAPKEVSAKDAKDGAKPDAAPAAAAAAAGCCGWDLQGLRQKWQAQAAPARWAAAGTAVAAVAVLAGVLLRQAGRA